MTTTKTIRCPAGTAGLAVAPWSADEVYAVAANWGQASAPVLTWAEDRWIDSGRQVADFRHEPESALAAELREACDSDVEAAGIAASATTINPPASGVEVEVIVGHRSSIAGARWCQPSGWSPRNRVEGADWSDGDGAWTTEEGEAAGIVIFGHDEEGETVTVSVDDLRVASSGECRVIGEVEIDFA